MGNKLLKWLRLVISALVQAVTADMKYLSLSATMTVIRIILRKILHQSSSTNAEKLIFLVFLTSNLSQCEETGGELALLVYPLQGKQSKPTWSF